MLTLGHSPLVSMMILRDDSFCQTHTSQRSFCTESLPIMRLHFLFMIAALDRSWSHWHPGLSLLSIPSLIWRCLHWGIAHSLMMILWDDSLYRTFTFQRLSCAESLSTSTWCIHTGAYPPCWFWHWDSTSCFDCCFRWIIESLTPWVQSSRRTWSDLDIHLSLLHTHPSYIGHYYTCTHLIRALHLLNPHISSSYMTLSLSLVIRGGCRLVLSFLVEFSHAFGH